VEAQSDQRRRRHRGRLKKIDKEAQKEAEDSAEFAKSSPYPEPETIFEDVYWEVDNKTEAGQTGRHFFQRLKAVTLPPRGIL
jgi:TPP-dependent pyruvate/acetoin dehydrogenase alpha subunit